MSTKIDGKQIAAEIKTNLAERVNKLKAQGIQPGLGTLLVGEDPGSMKYVAGKHADCQEVGITSVKKELPADASFDDIAAAVRELNEDPACTGFIVQLPLPKGINENAIIDMIDPAKDADGMHPYNLGELVLHVRGDISTPLPCTPRGVLELLDAYDIDLNGTVPEGLHDLVALLLGEVAVQAVHRKAQPCQLVCQCGGVELGIAEHHHPLVTLANNDLRQIRQLVTTGGLQHILGDLGLALLFGLDSDLLGVLLIHPADVHHLAADGGREHREGLAGLHQADDMLHVLIEAHIQHLVSLVEDHLCHMVEVDIVVLVVVHEAARGRHHDLTALGEALGLLFHIRTAVNADYLHFRHKIGQPCEFFSDLLGQLTGGGQNNGLRGLESRVDVLGHRDAESAGLASAGREIGRAHV